MSNVLRELINKHCLVYLDDIIVFSTSLDEHLTSLKIVFEELKNDNLKLQLDKCEFLKKETAFLGHIVGPNAVMPNSQNSKRNKIISWSLRLLQKIHSKLRRHFKAFN